MSEWPTLTGRTRSMNHDEIIELPPEHAGPVWDRDGDKWEKRGLSWYYRTAKESWSDLLAFYGPLSTTPPAHTWAVGDTIFTSEEAKTLPSSTVARDSDDAWLFRYDTGWQEPGYDGTTPIGQCEYPLTIIWLPKEK